MLAIFQGIGIMALGLYVAILLGSRLGGLGNDGPTCAAIAYLAGIVWIAVRGRRREAVWPPIGDAHREERAKGEQPQGERTTTPPDA